jgi:hypothetical protein
VGNKTQGENLSVLLTKYFWVTKFRRIRWEEHLAYMAERRGAYRVFVGELEGKRTLERLRRRWKDKIKIEL